MSMMMKLINAAAGQSVGDEIYYIERYTNTFRLVKIDFDAGTATLGANKSNGEYADASGHPLDTTNSYTGNSNGICVVGNDGYLYGAFKSDLDDNFANAQGTNTSILMRWNMKTLEPDPGYFYNLLARDTSTNSTLNQNIQEILYHEPSQTMSVVGTTESMNHAAVAYSFKIYPWPTTAIDALGSGAYHSTSNPNGRTMGTFLDNTNSADSSSSHGAIAIGSGTTTTRLHLMSNGKDQLGVTTQKGTETTSTDFMAWKRAYDTNGVGRSYESFNVGGSNFTYEMTTAENPWLEMTGFSIPYGTSTASASWKSIHSTNNSVHGIVNIWYRPGRDTAGIHKTPGTYYVASYDGYFYSFQEGSSKVEELGYSDSGVHYNIYTLLDNGCLVSAYIGGTASGNYTGAGIKIFDLDNRMPPQTPNGSTVATSKYATSFQHLPVVGSANDERIPVSKNPNGKNVWKIVQTNSGRMFCVLEAEPNNAGTRIIELFISDPDPNNFYRRSVSYGDSKLIQNSNLPINVYTNSNHSLVGNLPTAKISTGNTTTSVKTRFSDAGHAFMQDTPTDAIYIRENTHLYAINPNTRSNITSYDFANQGNGGATNASNVNPTNHEQSWMGGMRNPSAKFSEGNGSTGSSIDPVMVGGAEGGYGDVEGNTTFDLIYGDDTRLYMALKMDVQNVPAYTSTTQNQNNSHCLLRFHTGKDGTTIQCGERGPHPSSVDGIRDHPQGTSPSTANYVVDREYYYFGLLANQIVSQKPNYGITAENRKGGNNGMFSGINLMYDNRRNNVWVVGRRDLENCNNPDGRTNYSKMVVVPVGHKAPELYSMEFQTWPSHVSGPTGNVMPAQAQCTKGTIYGQIDNIDTTQARTMFWGDGSSGTDLTWFNSAGTYSPNGFERIGVISGQAINVTMNGKTSDLQDAFHPTLPNRGSQIYFSGMSNDATQYNSSHGTHPGSNTREDNGQNWVAPIGENRIGAVPFRHSSNGVNDFLNPEPGYLNSNRNHNTAVHSTQDNQNNHLYHAQIKLKNTPTTAVTAANNEEGIRCVWYYKGAFHGVTTYDEGTYVYMPEPEHGNSRDGHSSSPNDNTNTITHYVSQCDTLATANNVIGGFNNQTKIGTSEGCKNSDWAACVAPGGILCLPKQDSGYAKAGFIGINLGTKSILNTSSGTGHHSDPKIGQPFEAPSSVNPNNKQIKQMVVTSTGKIWAILDYEDPSASTLQFRILQVVFNSNYTSVTWSGGLYTSQASNSNSGHVKFYRTVCGNMPQSKMEWDAV